MDKLFIFFRYVVFAIVFMLCTQEKMIAQDQPLDNHYYHYYDAVRTYQAGDTVKALSLYGRLLGDTEFGSLKHIYNSINKAVEYGDTSLIKVLAKSGVRKGASVGDLKKFVKNEAWGGKAEYAELIDSELVEDDSLYYVSGLDSFLISELLYLKDRDQLFRDEYPYSIPKEYDKYMDSINFLVLKKIIEVEGQLPSYRKLGKDGSDALRLLLMHLDINMLSVIFPAIVESIRREEFFDADAVLYQIDRNIVGGSELYRYSKSEGNLMPFAPGLLFDERLGNFQYYGSMDMSDMKTRTVNFWPFHPNAARTIQQEMYDALCILPPFENPLKAHVRQRSAQEFIELFFGKN